MVIDVSHAYYVQLHWQARRQDQPCAEAAWDHMTTEDKVGVIKALAVYAGVEIGDPERDKPSTSGVDAW
jgi:hypothetical protein